MRVRVLNASYSAEPKNVQVSLEFIPETEPEIFQLPGLFQGKTATSTGFSQASGQMTGTFIVTPSS